MTSTYGQLAPLLEQDPDNPALIGDAAEAAFGEGAFDAGWVLIDRLDAVAPIPPALRHAAGLAAMRQRDWSRAEAQFAALGPEAQDAAAVRFNRAWSLAMLGRHDAAIDMLDDGTVTELPQAAALMINLMHDRGSLDEAMARARPLIDRHAGHRGFNAVLATLALDLEELDVAGRAAEHAGDHPEALAVRGMLLLDTGDAIAAARSFDEALAANPELPRAWLGRGLSRLTGGDAGRAASDLDRAAEMFGGHPGSWIAAGWAYMIAGDTAAAEARFRRALTVDDSFAESHGSIAVIDALAGRIDAARRGCDVARRLDRESFSAALAASLLASAAGDGEKAGRIVELALRTPLGPDGRTIGDALATLRRSR